MTSSSRTSPRIATLVLLLGAASARAQVPDAPRADAQPLAVGPVDLWPLFEANVERRSNLFQVSDVEGIEPEAATVWTAAPGFLARLPFSNSEAQLGYVAAYRDYGTADVEPSWNHYMRASTRLVFGNGAVLELDDDLQRGVLDTRAFDPGGDVTFVGERFHRNVANLGLGHERPDRIVFARFAHTANKTVGERRSGLYDVAENRLSLTGDHRRTPGTWLSWELVGYRADLDRPTESGTDFRTVRGGIARFGGRGHFGPATTWSLRGGWTDLQFEGTADSSFRGPSWEGRWRRQLAGGPALDASFLREVYPLLGGVGDYYVSDQLALSGESAEERRVGGAVRLAYYVSRYPELEPERTDRWVDLEASGRIRWSGWIEWRIYARVSWRSSTDPFAEFDDHRVGTALRLGG